MDANRAPHSRAALDLSSFRRKKIRNEFAITKNKKKKKKKTNPPAKLVRRNPQVKTSKSGLCSDDLGRARGTRSMERRIKPPQATHLRHTSSNSTCGPSRIESAKTNRFLSSGTFDTVLAYSGTLEEDGHGRESWTADMGPGRRSIMKQEWSCSLCRAIKATLLRGNEVRLVPVIPGS